MTLGPTESSAADRSTVEQATPSPSRPGRRSRRPSDRDQRRRLRLLYFTLASLWGFLIGTAGLLIGISSRGVPLDLGPVAVLALSAASILAVSGGMIASRAYREASRRRR